MPISVEDMPSSVSLECAFVMAHMPFVWFNGEEMMEEDAVERVRVRLFDLIVTKLTTGADAVFDDDIRVRIGMPHVETLSNPEVTSTIDYLVGLDVYTRATPDRSVYRLLSRWEEELHAKFGDQVLEEIDELNEELGLPPPPKTSKWRGAHPIVNMYVFFETILKALEGKDENVVSAFRFINFFMDNPDVLVDRIMANTLNEPEVYAMIVSDPDSRYFDRNGSSAIIDDPINASTMYHIHIEANGAPRRIFIHGVRTIEGRPGMLAMTTTALAIGALHPNEMVAALATFAGIITSVPVLVALENRWNPFGSNIQDIPGASYVYISDDVDDDADLQRAVRHIFLLQANAIKPKLMEMMRRLFGVDQPVKSKLKQAKDFWSRDPVR